MNTTIPTLARQLIKRWAKDNALCVTWEDGKAKVSITGYESWMWREHLIQLLGKTFVLQLDKAATEILNDGEYTRQPKR